MHALLKSNKKSIVDEGRRRQDSVLNLLTYTRTPLLLSSVCHLLAMRESFCHALLFIFYFKTQPPKKVLLTDGRSWPLSSAEVHVAAAGVTAWHIDWCWQPVCYTLGLVLIAYPQMLCQVFAQKKRRKKHTTSNVDPVYLSLSYTRTQTGTLHTRVQGCAHNSPQHPSVFERLE